MRHHVPFVGERNLVRGDDEQARAKRTSGRVIDDVIGKGQVESSWDDLVPAGWVDKSQPKPIKPSVPEQASVTKPGAHASNKAVPKAAKHSVTKHSLTKHSVAIKPGAVSTSITFSDSASMDWVPINSGRGLRVSVYGSIDNDLRAEWSRLLNDTASANIKEYEFNLIETPTLSLTGLGMLLLFKERKGSARNAIKLCNCNKSVAELLQWTGMDKHFAIETTQVSNAK